MKFNKIYLIVTETIQLEQKKYIIYDYIDFDLIKYRGLMKNNALRNGLTTKIQI